MWSPAETQRRRRIVHLILCPSLSNPTFPPKTSAVFADGGGGVDLGAVGRGLGLDPTTVKLNGHLLSRGADLVSSVTWDSLLSFFSSRGFPVGDSDRNPVVVQGKPAVNPVISTCDLEDEYHLSFKRKIRLDDEGPSKKKCISKVNSCLQKNEIGVVRDEDIVGTGRRRKFDENHQPKKPKISECNSGSGTESPKFSFAKSSFTSSCINESGKRLREDEMAAWIACKRIK